MKTVTARLTIALATLALAAPALAAAEKLDPLPGKQEGPATLITGLAVFVLTAIFLQLVVWPKISKGLAEREDKIRSEIDAAESARTQAKMALEQYERSLAEARTNAQKMIDQAKAQMNAQVAEMRARAEGEVASMKAKAMTDIEAAKKQALADIYNHSSALATQVAGKILQREVNGGDNARFMDEALAGMGRR
jgi:F-type H+-transporting ATPase subunit b